MVKIDKLLMSSKYFQELRGYKLADVIWNLIDGSDTLAKNPMGTQIIRSADSIGAKIAYGVGRGNYQEHKIFVRIARGSLNETKHC